MKRNFLAMIFAAIASIAFVSNTNADIIHSNDFENGVFAPDIGTWTFNSAATTAVVATSVAGDATLGDNVGLIDQVAAANVNLDLTVGLTRTAALSNGGSVILDFDFAARRTAGNTKTIFVDALDSSGAIVTRLVLGDSNAFGNGGNDRQRPGYDIDSTGNALTENSTLPGPSTPGSFWWGSDGNSANGFDVIRDAHISLTISESSFDISSTRAAGASYSTTGIANYNGGTFADIASFQLTSAGGNYGFYIDNFTVEAVPEPSSFILGLSVLGLCGFRRRRVS